MHTLTLVEGPGAPKSFALEKRLTTVGRGVDNDIVLESGKASKRHVLLSVRGEDDEVLLEDLNSRNGVWVDEKRVKELVLRPGSTVRIGECRLRYERGAARWTETDASSPRIEAGHRMLVTDGEGYFDTVPLRTECVYVGKSPDNDVVLPGRDVSRRHAMLVFRGGAWEIHDLESTNGTLVAGELIEQALVQPGHRFRIGRYLLTIEGPGQSVARPELEAEAMRELQAAGSYLPWSTQIVLLVGLLVICVVLVGIVAMRIAGRA